MRVLAFALSGDHVVTVSAHRSFVHVRNVRFEVKRLVLALDVSIEVFEKPRRRPLFVILVGNEHYVVAGLAFKTGFGNVLVTVGRGLFEFSRDIVGFVLLVERVAELIINVLFLALGITGERDYRAFRRRYDIAVGVERNIRAALVLTAASGQPYRRNHEQ